MTKTTKVKEVHFVQDKNVNQTTVDDIAKPRSLAVLTLGPTPCSFRWSICLRILIFTVAACGLVAIGTLGTLIYLKHVSNNTQTKQRIKQPLHLKVVIKT